MGSIRPYQSAAGKRYEVRYVKPDGSKGGKRGFIRKREAEMWLADLDSARAHGVYIDPVSAQITVNELGPAWLDSKRASMKPSAYAPLDTAWRLRVQPRWGRWRIDEVMHTDVRAWVAEMNRTLGATVTIRTFGVLASIMDDAVYDKRIAVNPARVGKMGLPRKQRGEHLYLTHKEALALANASGDRKLLVLILCYCGIRWGEAAGLRVKDVDLARGRLRVSQNAVEVNGEIHIGTPKSHKPRLVPVPSFLVEALAKRCHGRRPEALIFPAPDGRHMKRTRSSDGSKSWFVTALADAGLPRMTIHDLRHTAASLAVQSGANVKTVQRMLGHTSAAMTLDVYADLFDSDLDGVSDAMNAAALAAGADTLFEVD
ncbi:tyrosine-type recombinase/integrase [Microbacterium telephonicum]|uniref:Site-specific recombinase XerD n=1 Tax=Microbacterium telephonicum TaxID=1714841 RepID=A0A498CJX6_9MICO|nr:site-specific integrase [Microbacterium telephonicum]RLK52481.1 site-specific recombinase XerD [Microbacterium telephonicum]